MKYFRLGQNRCWHIADLGWKRGGRSFCGIPQQRWYEVSDWAESNASLCQRCRFIVTRALKKMAKP
jgi:hypothetical protein